MHNVLFHNWQTLNIMIKRIVLDNPPFTPDEDQVIYMEWEPNEGMNAFIRKNYEWLKKLFLSHSLRFCYLPLMGKEVIRYNAPHITDEECDKILTSLPSLQDCVVKDVDIHGPVLVFAAKDMEDSSAGSFILHYVDIETKWYKPTKKVFKELAEDIESTKSELKKSVASEPAVQYGRSHIRFSLSLKGDSDSDDRFEKESEELISEIRERINALRNKGVNTMFLHDIIDKEEKLSRLIVTKDYKIILPDYDNMEIEMAALPKAVFLLFLKHPEGIRFKELPEHYDELMQIYLSLNPMGGRQRQENSIRSVTDPIGNSINEKCARVREAFVSRFDDRLAKNYYITGKRGEPKRIILDKKLIVWEQ